MTIIVMLLIPYLIMGVFMWSIIPTMKLLNFEKIWWKDRKHWWYGKSKIKRFFNITLLWPKYYYLRAFKKKQGEKK